MPVRDSVTEWLLEGPAWVVYTARRDLLRQSEGCAEMKTARERMLADQQVTGLLAELTNWPVRAINSHKSAGHPLHKLSFLAELGLRAADNPVKPITSRILKRQAEQGPFQLLMNVPVHFGGSGKDELSWALCDSPLVLYALARFGLGTDSRVQTAARHLAGLIQVNGWRCEHGPELGKFRGPGRKDDPCPFANLVVLKALSELPEYRSSPACRAGAEAALALWSQRRSRHPYMFYMGTDFSKLKAPLVWYDIVHLLEVLSRFEWLRKDPRLQEIACVVSGRADTDGRYTPESVWKDWSGWEFGQKKQPSRWLTLLITRALRRLQSRR